MRIGIDARELAGRVTGVGRHLAALLREWSRRSPAMPHEFVLYTPAALGVSLDARRFRIREVGGSAGTWWEQVQLPPAVAADDLDVFFAPAYTAPLRVQVPVVPLIHDLSYVAYPEWFGLREGIRRRWLTQQTAARARSIITVSEFSRREIVARLGVPADRVHTIVPGIEGGCVASPRSTDPRVPMEPRVLYVGSLFNRRHVPDLIRAVGTLARSRPDTSLDIVGDDRSYPREELASLIVHLDLDRRVRWHRYVADDRLRALYGRARAFAFLSEYEGRGMTPLEALAAGVPPVVFDSGVARESYGDAALYVPVGDTDGVVRALELALFDDTTRAAILAAAPATLRKYDWARAARETLDVLETAGGSR